MQRPVIFRALWSAILIAAAALAACSGPGPVPVAAEDAPRPDPGMDWAPSPERIAESCDDALGKARARLASIVTRAGNASTHSARLVAIETTVADMNDALIAPRLLAHLSEDGAVRDASTKCNEARAAFQVELAASPAIYELATAALAEASTPATRQLARIYIEAGRRTGAGLDPATRAEVTSRLDQLSELQNAYMQALGQDRTTIEISRDEAASLPPSLVATLSESPGGYIVPVHFGTREQFLKSQASGEARKRYYLAFHNRGGQANVDRLEQALLLRHELSQLLGFESWAAYRLDTKMARTPERALALVQDVGARLLPRAREEIQTLARMKAELGDDTPFAAWDHAFYDERLASARHGVDATSIHAYFPIDEVVPAVLALYGALLGVRFEPVSPARAWAPDVQEFTIHDHASGELIARFFLDLQPRPGKGLHFSHYGLRPGRTLPDGSYQRPMAAIIGNGPPAEPGKPALLSHNDVIILFHEFGHLMHSTLSTAPYATLHGTSVRRDFVEAPSQMLENWMWEPSVLKRVSSHVERKEPLPDALIEQMIARRHLASGAFWTRQAFFSVYDMMLHSAGPSIDTSALWRELASRMTALPPAPDTLPQASFAGFMGGYDAGYYGYLWSRVYAQDMFTVFQQGGLDNPEIGTRYRREILEPGGTREPEELIERFLGRPARADAFYQELGLAP